MRFVGGGALVVVGQDTGLLRTLKTPDADEGTAIIANEAQILRTVMRLVVNPDIGVIFAETRKRSGNP
jgi:hypothetical protein